MQDLVLSSIGLILGSKATVVILTAYAIVLVILATVLHMWKYRN